MPSGIYNHGLDRIFTDIPVARKMKEKSKSFRILLSPGWHVDEMIMGIWEGCAENGYVAALEGFPQD